MNASGKIATTLKVSLLDAALGALGAAARVLNEKRRVVDLTVQQIEDAITALDPASRAAVVARLTAEAVDSAKARVGG